MNKKLNKYYYKINDNFHKDEYLNINDYNINSEFKDWKLLRKSRKIYKTQDVDKSLTRLIDFFDGLDEDDIEIEEFISLEDIDFDEE